MTVIGILGGGQLARMMAMAGLPLGLRFVFLDPQEHPSARRVGTHLRAGYDDCDQLARLARLADVVTYEIEDLPPASIAFLLERVAVLPGLASVRTARDRLLEKDLFRRLGIPTPRYSAAQSLESLNDAVRTIGLPVVLKTRTSGYDGRGQVVLRQAGDVAGAWARLGGASLIVEQLVEFDREVSLLSVRGRDGETRFYPLTENVHFDGTLRLSRCCPGDPFQEQAQEHTRMVLDSLGHVGVLTLELFQAGNALLANEMAPRVHNSGHWTIEGAVTSQFENHLRALLGWPLGSTAAVGHTGMVNIVGKTSAPSSILAVEGARLHLYDKPPRSRRKLGHVTVRAEGKRDLECMLARLSDLLAQHDAGLRALGGNGQRRWWNDDDDETKESGGHSPLHEHSTS